MNLLIRRKAWIIYVMVIDGKYFNEIIQEIYNYPSVLGVFNYQLSTEKNNSLGPIRYSKFKHPLTQKSRMIERSVEEYTHRVLTYDTMHEISPTISTYPTFSRRAHIPSLPSHLEYTEVLDRSNNFCRDSSFGILTNKKVFYNRRKEIGRKISEYYDQIYSNEFRRKMGRLKEVVTRFENSKNWSNNNLLHLKSAVGATDIIIWSKEIGSPGLRTILSTLSIEVDIPMGSGYEYYCYADTKRMLFERVIETYAKSGKLSSFYLDNLFEKKAYDSILLSPIVSGQKCVGITGFFFAKTQKLTAATINSINYLTPYFYNFIMENLVRFEEDSVLAAVENLAPKVHSGLMAKNIIHNMPTYLEGVNAKLGRVSKDANLSGSSKKAIEKAIDQLELSLDMTKRVLKLGDLQNVKLTKFLVYHMVEDVISTFEAKLRKNRVDLILDFGEENAFINGDYTLIEQSLFNIIDNSIEFLSRNKSKKNKKLTISLGLDEDNSTVISVHDNGPGMKPEVLDNCTKPLFSARGSSGLGLHMVKYIVEKVHKGKLEIDSEYRKYTEVRIILKS